MPIEIDIARRPRRRYISLTEKWTLLGRFVTTPTGLRVQRAFGSSGAIAYYNIGRLVAKTLQSAIGRIESPRQQELRIHIRGTKSCELFHLGRRTAAALAVCVNLAASSHSTMTVSGQLLEQLVSQVADAHTARDSCQVACPYSDPFLPVKNNPLFRRKQHLWIMGSRLLACFCPSDEPYGSSLRSARRAYSPLHAPSCASPRSSTLEHAAT